MFGRLAGYEDVNDADRLSPSSTSSLQPVMRAIVDHKGLDRVAASASQMGRFETEWLATEANLAVLYGLSGIWIDRVHDRKKPKIIILDMDSSVSPTHGDQEGRAAPRATRPTMGTSAAPATTRSSASTSSATWSEASCVPAMSIAPRIGASCWSPWSHAIVKENCAAISGRMPLSQS